MIDILLAAFALQATQAGPQQVEPMACTAEANQVTRQRIPFQGQAFRFTGTVAMGDLQADKYTPFALVSLLQTEQPHELSAVLTTHPATRKRFDVILRRLINEELRERSVLGRTPAGQAVPFRLEVTADRMAVFKFGKIDTRLPLGDFRPDAIVLGCSSGSFQFRDMKFNGNSG
jgi:curli biogenesis system outer membrane secretion channel CsgG